jgi:hypothetical protein
MREDVEDSVAEPHVIEVQGRAGDDVDGEGCVEMKGGWMSGPFGIEVRGEHYQERH